MSEIAFNRLIKGAIKIIIFAVIGIVIWSNRDLIKHSYFKQNSDGQLIYHPVITDTASVIFRERQCENIHQSRSRRPHINRNIYKGSVDNDFSGDKELARIQESESDIGIISILEEIITTTGNTISYFSAIIAALSIVAGIAMWKYYQKFLTTEERINKLKNSTLDNALITLYAVPFTEATQITSSKHLKAIRHIAELASDEENTIKENPKYTSLLLCKGLYSYFNGEYKNAIKAMLDAEKIVRYKKDYEPVKETISFHLSRTYKQFAFSIGEEKGWEKLDEKERKKILCLLNEAGYYATKAPSWLETSLILSIALIKARLSTQKNESAKIDDNILGITNRIFSGDENEPFSFNKMTAAPVQIKIYENSSNKVDANNLRNHFIFYMESRLQGQTGYNILASWYLSMARILCEMEGENNIDKADLYIDLSKSYYNRVKNDNDIRTLFAYDCLTEISKKCFEKLSDDIKRTISERKHGQNNPNNRQ
ncbi:hypothetical protein [Porphyromonas loveana]|nr:hypothetical protein [Porphyromonas loveana]